MPGTFGSGTFGKGTFGGGDLSTQTPPPPTSGAAERIFVREKPPLRTHIIVENSVGRRWRWGQDESQPENVFSSLRYSDTMPGGFESLDCTLSRHPARDYNDLERFSTIYVYGAGGELVGEYRLERAPQTSGNQMSVSPSAVGWVANLEDDKSAQMPYVDRSPDSWRPPSNERRVLLTSAPLDADYQSVSGNGGVGFQGVDGKAITGGSRAELIYEMPPSCELAKFQYRGVEVNINNVEVPVLWTGSVETNIPNSLVLTLNDTEVTGTPATPERYGMLRASAIVTHTPAAGSPFSRAFKKIAVFADHGLVGADSGDGITGMRGSEVVVHAVGRWAPRLNVTDESIQASSFIIPHLAFLDLTTAGEIIRQASRFGLEEWGVWGGKTFWWHSRGYNSRYWRARLSPSQFEETGASGENVWNSIVVAFNDVDGTTRTVGPIGSGAHTESSLLEDADPENPATKAGLTRRDVLQMGTTTPAGAIEVGRRFLEESKLIDRSGRMQIVGHVESRNGNLYPYSAVRAGDFISIVDAADTSYRRAVRTDKDHSTRTCSVDLDAPPEGLQALLERLSVVLIPLGIT